MNDEMTETMTPRRPLRPEEIFDAALALRERAERAEAEVERLKACLWQAVEIAEDLSSGDAWKFTSAEEKLDALKANINQADK